ncbi:hypothetical protein WJX82_006589 [Trebouxia sp. C0006]
MSLVKASTQTAQTAAYHVGAQVWVQVKGPADALGRKGAARWVRGRVTAVSTEKNGISLVEVQTEENHNLTLKAADCPLQNERDDTVDDLVKSDFLHEPGILQTLRVRYGLDLIYTYSGNILIAANPHKRLRHLYGSRMMNQYRNVALGELSPHVYAIAEQAFNAMMIDEQRQAILISGESGAGKTESAKMVMQYLAHRTAPAQATTARPRVQGQPGVSTAPVEEQVLESNPLLEAFGNAKTSRNDNSSRFGKFTEISFDAGGRVTGAAISTYLLERSRVVSVSTPERSYHIFYQLCAGASPHQRQQLRLERGWSSFNYLAGSETFSLTEVDDGEAFRETMDAMAIVGLTEMERDAVLAIVASVLHLGNISFTHGDMDNAMLLDERSEDAMYIVAELMQVTPDQLMTALTTRAIETMGERIVKNLDAAAASVSRDALAKNLYAKLFDWLVAAINRKISAIGSGQRSERTIGILDIYGFESFQENSFEQLCINLANERLQQQFNQHVFKGEQEEYAAEGIDWSYVEFIDNQDCLDLLEGSPVNPNLAVFPLIDEACRMPRATYQDLAHTVRTRLAEQPRFEAPKRPPHGFSVDHYAGKVTYSTLLLMDKNKDFVIAEHAALLKASGFQFARDLFDETDSIDSAAVAPPSRTARGGKSAYKLNSVGARFRKQLHGLMGTLNQCQPHYIRCIKPNPESQPGNLTPNYVLEQLRAGGVLEAVRIACAGYPTRKAFRPFAIRYNILLASGRGAYRHLNPETLQEDEAADISRKVLQAVKVMGWQMGETRVFLRAGQLAQLEGARGTRLSASAVTIQAAFRGMAIRKELRRVRAAARRIQAAWRGLLARRTAQERRKDVAAAKIAATWRMYQQRKAFVMHTRNRRATVVQSWVRMWLVRTRFRRTTAAGRKAATRAARQARIVAAAVVIQKNVRRHLACKKVAARRAEAVKWQQMQQAHSTLQSQQDQLIAEIQEWKARYRDEAAYSSELQAAANRLQSELTAAQLESQNAKNAMVSMREEVNMQANNYQSHVEAARVAELEAAQAAAQAALMAEMELLRRQKHGAEQQARDLEDQVRGAHQELRSKGAEVEEMVAAAEVKDADNTRLWDQVRVAAEEYHAEFAQKESTIAMLTAEAEAQKVQHQQKIDKLRTDMEGTVASVQQDMQQRLEEALAENKAQAESLREARERNMHFSARVVALNSRVAQLTKQLKDSQQREQALSADLEAAKKAQQEAQQQLQQAQVQVQAVKDAPLATPSPSHRSMENGGRTPPMRSPSQLTSIPYGGRTPDNDPSLILLQEPVLERDHEDTLKLLLGGVVDRRMSIINIQHGATPADSVGMPVAAWVLGECLLHWALRWRPAEVDVAATRLRDAVVTTAEADLTSQAYWLSATLALGAFLKVRSIGKRDCSSLFKLGDEMIAFTALHQLLASSVADMLPVNVSVLLCDEAKRLARQSNPRVEGSPHRQTSVELSQPGSKTFEGLMSSPWKGLLGGLSNVVECLRGEGAPPPAVRAVVHAALHYVDAELLNALVLRRDCCSISAIKALQAGLADIKGWGQYMGAQWCGDGTDIERALEHSNQAVRYLISGKDDCVRKACKGFDITPDLRRMCPSLTLQQIYKLSEHHHDDWITAVGDNQGTKTIVLLETLKRAVDSSGGMATPPPASPMRSTDGSQTPGGAANAYPSPASISSRHSFAEDEDNLLLDSHAAFVLPRKLLTEAARYFVQAPRGHQSAAPGVSLLDKIEANCRRNVQLPRQLRDWEQFAFLQRRS